eukprot:14682657-Alexandrium_andersonii.AAC.1
MGSASRETPRSRRRRGRCRPCFAPSRARGMCAAAPFLLLEQSRAFKARLKWLRGPAPPPGGQGSDGPAAARAPLPPPQPRPQQASRQA